MSKVARTMAGVWEMAGGGMRRSVAVALAGAAFGALAWAGAAEAAVDAPISSAPVAVTGCGGVQMTVREDVRDLLVLHNEHRASRGIPKQLCLHPELQQAANGHARDMAARDYFSHTTPEGLSPSDRARQAGYSTGVGENIGQVFKADTTPRKAFQKWLDSSGHRSNIEWGDAIEVGIGAADDAERVEGGVNWGSYGVSVLYSVSFGSGDRPASWESPPGAGAPASPANAAPVIKSLKPARGSRTRDTTPAITAVVRDAETNLGRGAIRVRVDGRNVRFSYDARTDRLKAQSPKLKAGQRHTLVVTATDASGATTKATSRFYVR